MKLRTLKSKYLRNTTKIVFFSTRKIAWHRPLMRNPSRNQQIRR